MHVRICWEENLNHSPFVFGYNKEMLRLLSFASIGFLINQKLSKNKTQTITIKLAGLIAPLTKIPEV